MQSAAPFVDKALAIAAKGWSVFPCGPKKTPLVEGGFKAATTDAEQIKAWGRKHPRALVGMPTGDRVFVLDIDRGHKDGADGFASLVERGWELPPTRIQHTRSGGAHVFFRVPDGVTVKSRAGVAPGLDIRGVGGYIIRWDAEGLPADNQTTVAVAPAWLMEVLASVTRKPEPVITITALPDIPPAIAATLNNDLGDDIVLHPEQIVEALAVLDPNMGHDDWVRVGMAIYHTTDGEGFDYWDEWSAKGRTYPGSDALLKRWHTFGGRVDNPVTGRTLQALAEKAVAAGVAMPPAKHTAQPPSADEPAAPVGAFDGVTVTQEIAEVDEAGQTRIVTLETRPDVPLPPGFTYDGINLCRMVKDEATEMMRPEPIFPGFLSVIRVIVRTMGEDSDQFKAEAGDVQIYIHPLGKRPMRWTMPANARGDKRGFSSAICTLGVGVMPVNAGYIQDLVNLQIITMQKTNDWVVAADQMGWQEDGAFVVGSTRYKSDGSVVHDIPAPKDLQSIAHKYTARGSLRTWCRVAAAYDADGGEPFQFALCYGAAGLFLPDTGEAGVMLSLYSSGSGKGKTTVGHGALSWWGDPATMKCKSSDTNNALFRVASAHKNLPMLIDEITTKAAWQVEEIVYDLCQGQEKRRMTSDQKVHAPLPPWYLPVISTANKSVRATLQALRGDSQGTQARLIELPMDEGLTTPMSFADRRLTRDGFEKNYGLAGPMLLKFAMNNRDKWQHTLNQFSEHLDRALGGDSAYRFWVASCAATLTVAVYAKQLGLVNYDVMKLAQWTIRMLRSQMDNTVSLAVSSEDLLARFLSANVNRIVVASMRRDSTGNMTSVVSPEEIRGNVLVGRVETATHSLFISRTDLWSFCVEAGLDPAGFERAASVPDQDTGQVLLRRGGGTVRVSLGKGTRAPSGRPMCLEFNLLHPSLVEYTAGIDSSVPEPTHLRRVQ